MKKQVDLIGSHPTTPSIFHAWLDCNDAPATSKKRHRELKEKTKYDKDALIDWLSKKLIEHHYDETRLQRLKDKYTELGFKQYAENHRKLPRADRTKKGNATEVILIEYIEGCQGKALVKHFKLRYNPNVDQAMKGDDVLLIDLYQEKGKDVVKVFLGEAKFRKKSTKTTVKSITKNLRRTKKPLSYSYLIDELGRNTATKTIADALDKFVIDEIKSNGNIIYAGFLLSDTNVFETVNKGLNSSNPDLVFISMGLNRPIALINKAFSKAEELILNPTSI